MRKMKRCCVGALLAACGEDGVTAAATAGQGGSTATTAASAAEGSFASTGPTSAVATTSTGTTNPEDPYGCISGTLPSRPPSIPEGWRPWGCWSAKPECLLWIPDEPETMVAPMEWGPCVGDAPGGEGCRQMMITWPVGGTGAIGATFPAVPELDNKSDAPLIRLGRSSIRAESPDNSYTEWVLAEPDGSARFAMRRPWFGELQDCGYMSYDLNESHWMFAAIGDDTEPIGESPYDGGVLVDSSTRAIRLLNRDDVPGGSAGWRVGRSWAVRDTGAKLHLHDHDFTTDIVIHDSGLDPLGAGPSNIQDIVGDAVIWQVSTSQTVGIRAYDPILGTHDLVRFLDDPTRGASTPGTDGIDLVWMEGSGRADGDVTYPVREMLTAPFTIDPDALEPRRLRSDRSTSFGTDGSAFRVGCGRAAKQGGTSTHDVQIVRLSDGRGWNLLHTDTLEWSSVVGLTCDEIFLVAVILGGPDGAELTLQRIRFDALGEGEPAD